jgi:ferredoxin
LKALLPFDNYQFYICGPEGFMRALYTGIRAMNIRRTAIHYEFFGAGSLADDEQQESNISQTKPTTAAVRFSKSNLEVTWTPDSGSLLELAEKNGLTPPQNCRSGKCGTCSTKLHSGSVYYPKKPVITPPTGQVLICCCWPKSGSEEVVLAL